RRHRTRTLPCLVLRTSQTRIALGGLLALRLGVRGRKDSEKNNQNCDQPYDRHEQGLRAVAILHRPVAHHRIAFCPRLRPALLSFPSAPEGIAENCSHALRPLFLFRVQLFRNANYALGRFDRPRRFLPRALFLLTLWTTFHVILLPC